MSDVLACAVVGGLGEQKYAAETVAKQLGELAVQSDARSTVIQAELLASPTVSAAAANNGAASTAGDVAEKLRQYIEARKEFHARIAKRETLLHPSPM
jgi:hypothetical protein